MVKNALVEGYIREGKEFASLLKKRLGDSFLGAFWYHFPDPESDKWRLMVVMSGYDGSPLGAVRGMLDVYREREWEYLDSDDLSAVGTKDRIYRAIRDQYEKPGWYNEQAVDREYLGDVYLYTIR
jgi:hypothetical protein